MEECFLMRKEKISRDFCKKRSVWKRVRFRLADDGGGDDYHEGLGRPEGA